jgi:hypothetical protein
MSSDYTTSAGLTYGGLGVERDKSTAIALSRRAAGLRGDAFTAATPAAAQAAAEPDQPPGPWTSLLMRSLFSTRVTVPDHDGRMERSNHGTTTPATTPLLLRQPRKIVHIGL